MKINFYTNHVFQNINVTLNHKKQHKLHEHLIK